MKFYTNNFIEYYLQGDIKSLLVTVNDKLKFEIKIVHDLSCHPILSCVLVRNVIIWSYWEHSNVVLHTALVSGSVKFMSIIPVYVLHVNLLIDWLSCFPFFVYLCTMLLIVYFVVCTSADMANKRVHNVVCDSLPTTFLYVCMTVSVCVSVCVRDCLCICDSKQSARCRSLSTRWSLERKHGRTSSAWSTLRDHCTVCYHQYW